MDYKFQINQRVKTPLGEGLIDALPYNEESDVYGVWLDRPQMIKTSSRVVPNRWVPVSGKYIAVV